VGQPKFVNYAYRQTTVDMNLAANDTVLHNKGINLDGVLSSNTDKSGNARGSDWSIGPYEMVSAPTVTEKIFNWSSSTYTVSENAGTLTIPCYRTGDTTGANTVAYTTTAGTAVAGVNYNTVSGTLSYGAGVGTNSVVVTINNVNFVGTKTFTVTLSSPTGDGAVIGNIGTATITINGAGVLAQPPNTPSITSPVDDSVNVELTPTITATDFSDPQSKTHTDTEWIIKNTQDIVLYSTGNGPSTSLVISSGLLDYVTEYQVQVRYKNSQNLWSTWSPFATFTTKTAPTPPAGTGSTNVNVYIFNGEIILNGSLRLKQ
jgi:RES domain-containing protein